MSNYLFCEDLSLSLCRGLCIESVVDEFVADEFVADELFDLLCDELCSMDISSLLIAFFEYFI